MAPSNGQPAGTAISRLAELPEELVSNISIKLGPDDIFHFRLTCKSLEEKSWHEFANEYFRAKAIFFTSESLKVLAGIAASKKLRGHLHTLYVLPALFSERTVNCSHGNSCVWHPTVRQTEAWHQYMKDQKTLKESKDDLKMIAQALKRLPSLERFVYTDTLTGLREVDILGYNKACRKTNNHPSLLPIDPMDKEFYTFQDHVWATMIKALATAKNPTLQHFETNLDQVKNPLSVLVNLKLSDVVLAGLTTALSNLHCASFHIASRKRYFTGEEDPDDDGINVEKCTKILEKFSPVLPAIKNLKLSFSFTYSSGVLCAAFLKHVDLSQILKLDLESIYIDSKSLCLLLVKLTSVENLHLNYVNLISGTWVPVLKALQKMETLRHLHIFYPNEDMARAFFVKPKLPVDETLPGATEPHIPTSPAGSGSMETDDDSVDEDDVDEEDDEDEQDNGSGVELGSADRETFHGFSSDTDSDMPDLEPQDAPLSTPAAPPPITSPSSTTNNNTAATPANPPTTSHLMDLLTNGPPFLDPSNPPTPEPAAPDDNVLGKGQNRGHVVCLKGPTQLSKWLPVFIKEYNVDDTDADADAMDAFVNSTGNLIGTGPPLSMYGNAVAGGAVFGMGPLPPGFPPLFPPDAGGGANGPGGGGNAAAGGGNAAAGAGAAAGSG